jgi:3-methyladenine DNA glycosylase/8-oxoguanine DNA glycosylase
VVLEQDVRPKAPYRLPLPSRDGVMKRRDGALVRLLEHGGERVVVRAWPAAGCVRLRAEAPSHEAAAYGIERMRFALGVDHDLRPFQQRFKSHPLLGPIIRRHPAMRPRRRPEPFEALAWAVTEQLITGEEAEQIQRRIVWRWGVRSDCGQFRSVPDAAAVAARAPAELDSCGLAPKRSIALRRVAREVAAGRADLSLHEPTWKRLLAIPEIGTWTVESLAHHGQGRDDQLPHGDLKYVKFVGRIEGLGRRATEAEVREWFAPFAPFQGLAGLYLVVGRRFALRGAPPPWVRTKAAAA